MKILHLVHWENSGIAKIVSSLKKEGESRGDSHEVIVMRKEKTISDFLKSIFVALEVFIVYGFRRDLIIHSHSFLPFLHYFLFPFSKKCATFHSDYPFLCGKSKRDKLKRYLLFLIFRLFKVQISAVGSHVSELVGRSLHVSVNTISNGIRIDDSIIFEEKKIKDGAIVIDAAGRLNEENNFRALIKSLPLSKNKNFTLLIAGEGDDEANLYELIHQLDLSARVKLLGHQNNMRDFYNGLDVFVCTSRYEGFGLVLIEAMLSSLPIISTKVGVFSDCDDLEYMRVEPTPESIAAGIDLCLETGSLSSNNAIFKNFDYVKSNFNILKIYDDYKFLMWNV